MAYDFGIVDGADPRRGDHPGDLRAARFVLQHRQQRRSVQNDLVHSPLSATRFARNASTEASGFPSVNRWAIAFARATAWAAVRRTTPSSVSSRNTAPPSVKPSRLRRSAGRLIPPVGVILTCIQVGNGSGRERLGQAGCNPGVSAAVKNNKQAK